MFDAVLITIGTLAFVIGLPLGFVMAFSNDDAQRAQENLDRAQAARDRAFAALMLTEKKETSMKVIKLGKKPEERSAEATCYDCGTVVEVMVKECRMETDRSETAYVWKCPTCNRDVWTDTKLFT